MVGECWGESCRWGEGCTSYIKQNVRQFFSLFFPPWMEAKNKGRLMIFSGLGCDGGRFMLIYNKKKHRGQRPVKSVYKMWVRPREVPGIYFLAAGSAVVGNDVRLVGWNKEFIIFPDLGRHQLYQAIYESESCPQGLIVSLLVHQTHEAE